MAMSAAPRRRAHGDGPALPGHRGRSRGDRPCLHRGRFSHAVTKAGLLAADAGETDRLWEREVVTPGVATPAQRRIAEAVIAAVTARFGPTVYARIDLVGDEAGCPRVLEAELVEPSLFLAAADGAAQHLAAAL